MSKLTFAYEHAGKVKDTRTDRVGEFHDRTKITLNGKPISVNMAEKELTALHEWASTQDLAIISIFSETVNGEHGVSARTEPLNLTVHKLAA